MSSAESWFRWPCERRQGTLPLLLAAPLPLWPVFVGRSVQWLPTGLLSSSAALFVLGPFFGVTWRPPQALAVFGALVVIGASMYCMALVFGALVLAAMDALGIGATWLIAAAVLLERLAGRGRRSGSIELAA